MPVVRGVDATDIELFRDIGIHRLDAYAEVQSAKNGWTMSGSSEARHASTYEDFLLAAEYILAEGNSRLSSAAWNRESFGETLEIHWI